MTTRERLASVEELVDEARNGRMFILVDDEQRENEGDLVIPAQMATPDAINFMARYGRGLVCLALTRERVDHLRLPPMAPQNGSRHETAFTVSIEAKDGVTTGISAADRARTIAVAIDSARGPGDLVTPGHIFPLAAREGGVLVRAGHTEAAVDISRLAGLNASSVICEIMKDDGSMARMDDLVDFADRHRLRIGTIRDLIAYRRRHDNLVQCIAEARIASRHGGDWLAKTYINKAEYAEHLVLQKGLVDPDRPALVRMHTLSVFTDVLGAGARPDQLPRAMETIASAGGGLIVIIRDTRPDAMSHLMGQHREPDAGELRDYGIGAQILLDLGVQRMILLTDSPHRTLVGLAGYGLDLVEERPIGGDGEPAPGAPAAERA